MDRRVIHHLISHSLSHPEPIACASVYDDAAHFVAEEMGGLGVISLHVSSTCGPCPICQSDAIPGPNRSDFSNRYGKVGEMAISELERARAGNKPRT